MASCQIGDAKNKGGKNADFAASTSPSGAPPPNEGERRRSDENNDNDDDKNGGGKDLGGGTKKIIAPPHPRTSDAVGIYGFEVEYSGRYPVIRYQKNGVVMSRKKFISELKKLAADDFRSAVNKSIATLPMPVSNNGYMLQAPAIRASNQNDAFYFVAIPSNLPKATSTLFDPQLIHCAPSPAGVVANADYTNRFLRLISRTAGGVAHRKINSVKANLPYASVIFKGGIVVDAKEIMVVPCPITADLRNARNAALGHIYAFAQAISDESKPDNKARLQSFWYTVATAASWMFNNGIIRDADKNPRNDLYLSTHGIGQHYLHFRVENHPSHYNQLPELISNDNKKSRDFYDGIFK